MTTVSLLQNFYLPFDLSAGVSLSAGNGVSQGSLGLLSPESQFLCADFPAGNLEPPLYPLRHALFILHPVLGNCGGAECHLEEYHPVQLPASTGAYDVMVRQSPRVFVEPGFSDHEPQAQGLMGLVQQFAGLRQTQHRGCVIDGADVIAVMGPSSPPPQITAADRDMALKALINNPYEQCYAIEPGSKEIEGPVQIEAREAQSAIVDEALLFYSYLRGNAATGIEQSFQKAADLLFTSRNLEHVISLLECEVDGERIIPEGVMDYFWPHLLAHTTELGLACAFFTEMLRDLDLSFAAVWLVDILERMPDPGEHRVQRAAQFLNALVEQGQNALVNACFGKVHELTHTSLLPQRDMTLIKAHALLFVAYGEARYINPLNVQPDWHGAFVTCEIKQEDASKSPVDNNGQASTIRERFFRSKKTEAFVEHVPQNLRKYFTAKAREALETMLTELRSYTSIQCLKRLIMNLEQYENDQRSHVQLERIMRADAERLGLRIVFLNNKFIIGHSEENGNLQMQLENDQTQVVGFESPLAQAVRESSSLLQDVRFGYINQIRKALSENNYELAATLLFNAYQDPVMAINRIAIALSPEELAQIFASSTLQKLTRFLLQGLGITEEQSFDMTDQQAMSERLKIIMPALVLMPLQEEENSQGLTLESYLTYLLTEKNGTALGITLLTGHLYVGHEASARLEKAYEHVSEGQPWYDLYRVIVSGRLLPDDLVLLRQGSRLEDRVLVLLDRIMRTSSRFTEMQSQYSGERLYIIFLDDLNHLHTLLKEESVPLELKELCAKIIVQFQHDDSPVRDGKERHVIRLANILGELTGLFDGELGLWVDFYAPAEPSVAKQIEEYGATFYKKVKGGQLINKDSFEALALLVQRHDRNSWLALQTLLEAIGRGMTSTETLKQQLINLVKLYLEYIDLSGMILRGIKFHLLPVMTKELAQQIYDGQGSFSGISFNGLDMSGLQAPHAVFENTDLRNTKWVGADLSQAQFKGEIKFRGADFRGSKLPQNLTGVNLYNALLQGLSLRGIYLIGARLPNNLEGVDFSGAIIDMEQLKWIRQHKGTPKGAVLTRESFVNNPDLNGCDLRGVGLPEDLTDIQFNGARLDVTQVQWIIEHKGCLAGVVLIDVDLSGMDLSEQDLSGVDFRQVTLQGTILRGTKLSGVKLPVNLVGVDFNGAIISIEQLKWIQQHKGTPKGAVLTRESFVNNPDLNGCDLRGVGLPEDLTDIQFYGAMLDANQIQWIIEHRGSLAGVMIGRKEFEYILSLDVSTRPSLNGIILVDVDLSGKDLSGLDLSGVDLSRKNLQRAILSGTNLVGASLPYGLNGVDFSGAIIDIEQLKWIQQHGGSQQGAVLTRESLVNISDFKSLDLRGVGLPEDLTDIQFYGAMLDADQIQWIIEHRGSLAGVMIGRKELEYILSLDEAQRPRLQNVLFEKADLSGMDLSEQDLSGADLRQVILQGTILRGTKLNGVKLPLNLEGVDFSGVTISVKQLRWIRRHGGSIAGAVLSQESFANTPNLEKLNLRGVQLPQDLSGVRFKKTRIDVAQVEWIIDRGGSLAGAILGRAELEYILSLDATRTPSFQNVCFTGADLSGLDLSGLDLSGADLIAANLQGTNLHGTNLIGAKLPYRLTNVSFCGAFIDLKQLGNIQLQNISREGIVLIKESFAYKADVQILDLRGIRLPEDLSEISINGTRLDVAQIQWVIEQGGSLFGVVIEREELEYILSLDEARRPKIKDLVLKDADLSGMDLSGLDLSGVNLSQTNMQGASLQGTNLIGVTLPRDLKEVDFSGAIIDVEQLKWIQQHGSSPKGAYLTIKSLANTPVLYNLDLRGVQLPENVAEVHFNGAWLDAAQVRWIIEHDGSLSGAILKEVDLKNMPLQGAVLRGADLREAILPDDMKGLSLIDCKLDREEILWVASHEGSLIGVDLSELDLSGIQIPVGTDLSQVNFTNTNLTGAIMSGVKLAQAIMTGACLDNADLTNVDFGEKSIKFASARNARFDGARAYYVNFRRARITGASFEGAGVHSRYLEKIKTYGARFTQISLLTEDGKYNS